MALTEKEQFRLGFLTHCARLGLAPAEVREMTKQAVEQVKTAGTPGMLAKLYATAPFALAAYGLAGSAGAGALGGHVLAKMNEEETDPEQAKQQELMALYRQQAERARRNAARLRYRQSKTAPRQPSLF